MEVIKLNSLADETSEQVRGRPGQSFKLLGDKVLVALIRTPGKYGDGDLQLFVPSIAREYMNIGVVGGVSDEAGKVCKAQHSDVVMVQPYKGAEVSEGGCLQLGLDPKRRWMFYPADAIIAVVTTDFREI